MYPYITQLVEVSTSTMVRQWLYPQKDTTAVAQTTQVLPGGQGLRLAVAASRQNGLVGQAERALQRVATVISDDFNCHLCFC